MAPLKSSGASALQMIQGSVGSHLKSSHTAGRKGALAPVEEAAIQFGATRTRRSFLRLVGVSTV
jgi:hypothetical protein